MLRIILVAVLLAVVVGGSASLAGEKQRIGFCVNMIYSPLLMYKRYQPLMDYLTEHTPFQFELVVCRSNREVLQAFAKGTIQVALLDDFAFIGAHERFKAQPILKPLNPFGEPVVRSVLVVAANSPIRSIGELRGKRILFGAHHSVAGFLSPHYLLWRAGVELRDLASYRHTRSESEILRSLLTGTCDAGVLADNTAEKYANLGLRVLARSNSFPTLPILVPKNASPTLVRSISSALLMLDRKNPEHERLMKQWDPKLRYGFTGAGTGEYQQMIRMFKAVPAGCGTGCHPGTGGRIVGS